MNFPFKTRPSSRWSLAVILFSVIVFCCGRGEAKDLPESPVEINGDQVEFSMGENKVLAQGSVEVVKDDVTLLCDQLEYFRDTQVAYARGNVVLIRDGERVNGDSLEFNFGTMQGSFQQANIYAKPFYGSGEKITKIGDNHIRMHRGGMTTCDLDKPHFRMVAKKVDIYPGEKAVARNVRLLIGKFPIMYMPRYTQDLRDKEPAVIVTPGYDGDWGPFVLTKTRFQLNDHVKGDVRVDYRQKKDIAWGINLNYDTVKYGTGLLRTYYMNERNTTADYFFDERTSPTVERERYKIQWRHKWDVDDKTTMIAQYVNLSDSGLLKDYFKQESEDDSSPSSYFLLTRGLALGTLSLQADVRINRFENKVEKLPELSFDMPNKEILDTGFYFKNTTTYSNLVEKTGNPSEDRTQTMRVNWDSELSYPMKIGFVEFTPFVGGSETFYSKTKDKSQYNVVRGQLLTGADLSTKFYRIFDVQTDWLKLNINRLRHIITPSIAYVYKHDPTIPNTLLDEFDDVDALARAHSLSFTLENKLQTKRDDVSVDLVRTSLGTTFRLKEDPGKGGFNDVTADIELTPYNWLSFAFDASYDTVAEHLTEANFDLYVNNDSDDWYFKLGKRYHVDVDDQITTEVGYTINPKWKFRVYQRFDIDSGTLKEQEYGFRRDLHCWIMDINFNSTRGEGDEIWLVFTMKAFPEIGFDFGTNFNSRKAGAQN